MIILKGKQQISESQSIHSSFTQPDGNRASVQGYLALNAIAYIEKSKSVLFMVIALNDARPFGL